jgi:hypothetical protein
MSANDDRRQLTLTVPALIRDDFELLDNPRTEPRDRLRAIRSIQLWLSQALEATTQLARETGMTWEQIGEAQSRPRQVVHRQATSRTPRRPRVRGLTSPDFEGVGTPDLRYWLKWWSDPDRDPKGYEERGRDPLTEQRKIKDELNERERRGYAGPNRDQAW